jgi:uncharacterized protein
VIVEGTFTVDAGREDTWVVLSDPRSLAALLPGCESVEPGEEGAYRLTAQARVGPFKAKLSGTMSVLEARPAEAMRVRVEGQDGVTASRVRAAMGFTLTSESDRRTTVAYSADILISGRLATVGHGIVRITVRTLVEEFVRRLDATLRREPIAESGSDGVSSSGSETEAERSP